MPAEGRGGWGRAEMVGRAEEWSEERYWQCQRARVKWAAWQLRCLISGDWSGLLEEIRPGAPGRISYPARERYSSNR